MLPQVHTVPKPSPPDLIGPARSCSNGYRASIRAIARHWTASPPALTIRLAPISGPIGWPYCPSEPVLNSLSIRTYQPQATTHIHPYHQLVLPLQGAIRIELEGYRGLAGPGDCVVIRMGQRHDFGADASARFLVADLDQLPVPFFDSDYCLFRVSPPLQRFLLFVEQQLAFRVDPGIEQTMVALFTQLLAQEQLQATGDPLIRSIQSWIADHLAEPLTINGLAHQAGLGTTQFKKRFRHQLGTSPLHYITHQRMHKARALLSHTDLNLQQVAEQCGYQDVSAFSRRFSQTFGQAPGAFARRQVSDQP